jgi:hypothetical protein
MATKPLPKFFRRMSADEYTRALEKMGWTPYAAALPLGISLRQSHRYASGNQPVKPAVARLLRMYLRHGLPEE